MDKLRCRLSIKIVRSATGSQAIARQPQVSAAAYYPIPRGEKAIEIRKMYLLPVVRGRGIGCYLLQKLEKVIARRVFPEIWLETASVFREAVCLYEKQGYQLTRGNPQVRSHIYQKVTQLIGCQTGNRQLTAVVVS